MASLGQVSEIPGLLGKNAESWAPHKPVALAGNGALGTCI